MTERLSDIAWNQLRSGLVVISPQGTIGTIVEVIDDSRGIERDPDRCIVVIEWENGNVSRQSHFLLDTVILF